MRASRYTPSTLRAINRHGHGSAWSRFYILTGAFATRRLFVLAGFEFVMPPADLLLNLLGNEVDGGIEIAFDVLGEQIGAGQRQTHRAGELALRGLGLIRSEEHTSELQSLRH